MIRARCDPADIAAPSACELSLLGGACATAMSWQSDEAIKPAKSTIRIKLVFLESQRIHKKITCFKAVQRMQVILFNSSQSGINRKLSIVLNKSKSSVIYKFKYFLFFLFIDSHHYSFSRSSVSGNTSSGSGLVFFVLASGPIPNTLNALNYNLKTWR